MMNGHKTQPDKHSRTIDEAGFCHTERIDAGARRELHFAGSREYANLRPGEAFIWSSKAKDEAFTNGTVKTGCRAWVA